MKTEEGKIEEGKFYRTRDGRKAGPIRAPKPLEAHPDYSWIGFLDGIMTTWIADGHWADGTHAQDLVAEWIDVPSGPVRTVTRKEIVPGVYGRVCVQAAQSADAVVGVRLASRFGSADGTLHHWSLDELRVVIATLTEIADALGEAS